MLKRRLTDPLRVVLWGDDALDVTADEYKSYVEGWCDWSKLKCKEGAKPTVFVVKPLTHRQRVAMSHLEEGSFAQSAFVVRCCLIGVEGFDVAALERKPFGDAGDIVTEDWLDKAGLTASQYGALFMASMAVSEMHRPFLERLNGLATDMQ